MGGSSGSGGGGQTQTTVQKAEPWSGQQAPLTRGFERAEELYKAPSPSFYPAPTYVPFSPQTETALNMQESRARFGSPLLGAAQNEVGRTVSGHYQDAGNPAFGAMMDRVQNQVRPRLDAQFAGAGRGVGAGSGAGYQEAYARALADAAAPLSYQNYDKERDRQVQGALVAPQLAQEDYRDIGQLASAGQAREGLAQASLEDQIKRHNFEQARESAKLQEYMNLIQGNYGGQSTSTSVTDINRPNAGFMDYLGPLGGLAANAGLAWKLFGFSSRTIKTPRGAAPKVLDQIEGMPIEKWRYVYEDYDDGPEHIGPYAEDFAEAFGVGDGTTINFLDAIGVLFKAVQELRSEVRALKAEFERMTVDASK